jgi:hypothetical protein
MGGRAEGLAFADQGARTTIGAIKKIPIIYDWLQDYLLGQSQASLSLAMPVWPEACLLITRHTCRGQDIQDGSKVCLLGQRYALWVSRMPVWFQACLLYPRHACLLNHRHACLLGHRHACLLGSRHGSLHLNIPATTYCIILIIVLDREVLLGSAIGLKQSHVQPLSHKYVLSTPHSVSYSYA